MFVRYGETEREREKERRLARNKFIALADEVEEQRKKSISDLIAKLPLVL